MPPPPLAGVLSGEEGGHPAAPTSTHQSHDSSQRKLGAWLGHQQPHGKHRSAAEGGRGRALPWQGVRPQPAGRSHASRLQVLVCREVGVLGAGD